MSLNPMHTLTFVTFGTFCHRAPPDHCLVALWCSRQRRLHRQPCRFPHCVQVGVQVGVQECVQVGDHSLTLTFSKDGTTYQLGEGSGREHAGD